MTLKSALQDVKETTLAAVSGLLGKLAYLASLRRGQGRYEHWGMELVHGPESSERALKDGSYRDCDWESYGRRWSLWSRIWTNRAEAAELLPSLILKECASASTTCCRASARTRPPRVTLIQCCWPFRAWRRIEGVPLGQFHSHSHDLAEHFCFLRVTQDPNRNRRQRMRLQNDFLAAHAAPAAGMAIAGFHKIDRTFIFRAPGTFHHFASSTRRPE